MTGDAPNTLQAYYIHVEGEHGELNSAFAPLLTNGKSAKSARDELLGKVEKMSESEAEHALSLLESKAQ
jgi:hypothetical protein